MHRAEAFLRRIPPKPDLSTTDVDYKGVTKKVLHVVS